MDNIDIRKLDWQPNPHDAHAATATVQAGDRKLRIDAAFNPSFVQDSDLAPKIAIIDALRQGCDFKHIQGQAVPLDAEGNVFVSRAINSGHTPAVRLDMVSVEAVNGQLASLVNNAADPSARIYSAAAARRMEDQARAAELRPRAASLSF